MLYLAPMTHGEGQMKQENPTQVSGGYIHISSAVVFPQAA